MAHLRELRNIFVHFVHTLVLVVNAPLKKSNFLLRLWRKRRKRRGRGGGRSGGRGGADEEDNDEDDVIMVRMIVMVAMNSNNKTQTLVSARAVSFRPGWCGVVIRVFPRQETPLARN